MSDAPLDNDPRSIKAERGQFEAGVFPPTVVIHGRQAGLTTTTLHGPQGTSVSRIAADGEISLVLQAPENVGRSGETRVAKHLRAWLEHEGWQAEFRPGEDGAGEDRRLKLGAGDYIAQIVTVPSAPRLWADAKRSSAETTVSTEGAVGWIYESINMKVAKTARQDRENMILVLDARYANPLTEPSVIDAYLSKHGDPSELHSFAGVCVVGSTSSHCARIGKCIF